MKIHAGFTLGFESLQYTPMLLVLNIHPSRRVDLLSDQILTFNQPIDAWNYTDTFGNACTRIVAPPGLTTVSTDFEIYDSGQPDVIPVDAVQHDIKDLPDEVLQFLLGVTLLDEHMSPARWAGFVLVWVALVLFTIDSLSRRRREQAALALV